MLLVQSSSSGTWPWLNVQTPPGPWERGREKGTWTDQQSTRRREDWGISGSPPGSFLVFHPSTCNKASSLFCSSVQSYVQLWSCNLKQKQQFNSCKKLQKKAADPYQLVVGNEATIQERKKKHRIISQPETKHPEPSSRLGKSIDLVDWGRSLI